ncbi:MAG: hypothetical protein KDE15_00760 [Erythrobacter sp.]|nr:hypothetical protein [Erythrobacter sp.]
MVTRALGDYFDSPDTLFHLMNSATATMTACNTLNQGGVIAALMEAPAAAGALAARCDLPADRVERLLAFLAGHGIVERSADGTYTATARTQVLHDASAYLASTEIGARAGSQLLASMRAEGKTAFELYYGQPVFAFFTGQPEVAARFGAFMGWMTCRVQRFLFAEHRFAPFGTVADIGGSMGDLLLAVLEEYPGTRGVLFDLPDTVELARPGIAASPLADRVEIVGGSFFDAVPPADLYTTKQILHDWSDEECVHILRNVRKAINPGGRLAVIDHIVSDPPAPDEAQSTDIAMMIWDTGHERRLAEFEALFAASGFRLERVSRNPSGHSVIEALPVQVSGGEKT